MAVDSLDHLLKLNGVLKAPKFTLNPPLGEGEGRPAHVLGVAESGPQGPCRYSPWLSMIREPLLHALENTDQDRLEVLRPSEDQGNVRAQVLFDQKGRRIRFEGPPEVQHDFGGSIGKTAVVASCKLA